MAPPSLQPRIFPVVLCGGGGTRLWPKSVPERPKPFLSLVGDQTLFAQTIHRLQDAELFGAPVVVAGQAHLDLVRHALADTAVAATLIAEPVGRNTAPAIALAALQLPDDAIMLVCPSDHHIADTAAFRTAVGAAAELAAAGRLVTLGIAPDRPETGYGYIELGEPLGASGHAVRRFVEKPDRATAAAYLAQGGFCWNAGIFVMRADSYLAELARLQPQMLEQLRQAVQGGRAQGNVFLPDAAAFEAVAGLSIDYAVMEHTALAAVVPVSMGWSDIGTWAAVAEARGADASPAPHRLINCERVMIESDGPRVSAIGLNDVVIVVAGGELLVTTRDGSQLVGRLATDELQG